MKSKNAKTVVCDDFGGIDCTRRQVSENCACDSANFIPLKGGGIAKRHGLNAETYEYADEIYGVFIYRSGESEKRIVHSGRRLYCDGEIIRENMAESRSRGIQTGGILYILDGENFIYYNGETIHGAGENPYIPLIYTHRKPDGGGERNEKRNIFTRKVREGFIADGQSTQYVLSATGLKSDDITCTVYKDDGTSYTVTTGDGMTVNADRGIVTFSSAPPLSRASDRDNVIVTYTSNARMDVSVLNKCTQITAFGKGGARDTLFLSGNEYYTGIVWYSCPENPLYFGAENIIDTKAGRVCGFSSSADRLFIHGNMSADIGFTAVCDDECNVINIIDGAAVYEDTVTTPENEPLFLTKRGLYAVTKNSASLDNLTLKRCDGLDGYIENHKDDKFYAASHGGDYILLCGNDIMIIRGGKLWRMTSDYGFTSVFTEGGRLKFVSGGKIFSFGDGYCDGEKDVAAYWHTGGITGENLCAQSFSMMCASGNSRDVTVSLIGERHTEMLKRYNIWHFSFSDMVFSRLCFAPPRKNAVIKRKASLKNEKLIEIHIESPRGGCEIRKWAFEVSER